MKKLILAIVLAVVSSTAFAEDYIYVAGLSSHTGSTKERNEQNWGLGHAWETKWSWFGDVTPQYGFYKNSQWRWTAYATFTKYYWETDDKLFRLGSMQGVAIGYEQTPILPYLAFVGLINTKPVGVNILLSVYRDSGGSDEAPSSNKYKPLVGLQAVIPWELLK